MLLQVSGETNGEELCRKAADLGIRMVPVDRYRTVKKDEDPGTLIFYYSDIPLDELR